MKARSCRLWAALVGVVAGLLGRSASSGSAGFLLLSLVALAGMATGNVLLPSLVKLHFPTRVGFVTALYTTSMTVGLTAASALTVPMGEALHGWREGLASWAAWALLAILPWLVLARREARPTGEQRSIALSQVARTPLGRKMALLFGLQSLQAYSIFGWLAQVYRDAGFEPDVAGLLLGLVTAVGIPLSFWVPSRAARVTHQGPLMLGMLVCYPLAYLGLILAPAEGALVWVALLGVATTVFPLVLTLISLRARTSEGTAALSGFTQGVGYLIAVVGPFGTGALYDLSGRWTVPLGALLVLTLPQIGVGLAVSRPAYIEDELEALPPAGH